MLFQRAQHTLQHFFRWVTGVRRHVVIGTTVAVSIACGDPGPNAPKLQSAEDIFWTLELNYRAVNLAMVAPYDTVTLVATPKNVYGETLTNVAPAIFSSGTEQVVILPNGVIRGIAQTSSAGAIVAATLTVNGVTRSDTARVVVTNVAQPQLLRTFSIQLPASDSTTIAATHFLAFGQKSIPLTALDSLRQPIPRTIAYFQSSTPAVGTITGTSRGTFSANSPGEAVIRATAHVYGVTMTDSLKMTVTERTIALVLIPDGTAMARETVVRTGGEVFWVSRMHDSVDIVFDNPDSIDAVCCTALASLKDTSGNIAPFVKDGSKPDDILANFTILPRTERDNTRGRKFPRAGRYPYHSVKQPTVYGTIVVR